MADLTINAIPKATGPTQIDDSPIVIDGAGNIHIQSGLFAVPIHTPASSSAPGVAGAITWDSSFIYICIATNTWARVAVAVW